MSVRTTSSTASRASRQALSRVYFVEAIGHDLVKIGYAFDLPKRFTAMMTMSPAPLTLLGTLDGGAKLEMEIHDRLAASRAHGEWFHKTPEVMEAVAAAMPAAGQEWLNQKAKIRGAALMDFLAKLKAGEVTRRGRGPAKRPPSTKPGRYAWSPARL